MDSLVGWKEYADWSLYCWDIILDPSIMVSYNTFYDIVIVEKHCFQELQELFEDKPVILVAIFFSRLKGQIIFKMDLIDINEGWLQHFERFRAPEI